MEILLLLPEKSDNFPPLQRFQMFFLETFLLVIKGQIVGFLNI